MLTHDTMDALLDSFLIIIHRECEGFQDPAFAESAWKIVAAWEELLGAHKDGSACKPHPSRSPQHQA